MSGDKKFSLRQFLKDREALLVHFNTPMSGHCTGFPDDLHQASKLKGVPLSFSTIQANDRGPWQGGPPSDTNAGGSVGLVVDIKEAESVISVGPGDDGTKASPTGNHQTGGSEPSAYECARSIDKRVTANEWFVRDYIVLGIFIFCPARVFVRNGCVQEERDTCLLEVMNAYSEYRVFTTLAGSFQELDLACSSWQSVTYSNIVT